MSGALPGGSGVMRRRWRVLPSGQRMFSVHMTCKNGKHRRDSHFGPRHDHQQEHTGNSLPCHTSQVWQKTASVPVIWLTRTRAPNYVSALNFGLNEVFEGAVQTGKAKVVLVIHQFFRNGANAGKKKLAGGHAAERHLECKLRNRQ